MPTGARADKKKKKKTQACYQLLLCLETVILHIHQHQEVDHVPAGCLPYLCIYKSYFVSEFIHAPYF